MRVGGQGRAASDLEALQVCMYVVGLLEGGPACPACGVSMGMRYTAV